MTKSGNGADTKSVVAFEFYYSCTVCYADCEAECLRLFSATASVRTTPVVTLSAARVGCFGFGRLKTSARQEDGLPVRTLYSVAGNEVNGVFCPFALFSNLGARFARRCV